MTNTSEGCYSCHRLSSRIDLWVRCKRICGDIQGNVRFGASTLFLSLLVFFFILFIYFLHEGREKPLTKISDKKEVGGTHDFLKSKMAAISYWRDLTFRGIDAGEWKRGVSRWWRPLVKPCKECHCRLPGKMMGQFTHPVHQCYRNVSRFWSNRGCINL